MAGIVVLAGPDPGHALPGIGLAAALVRRAHDVRLITGDQHERTAWEHGVSIEPLPSVVDPGSDALGPLWGRASGLAAALADRLRAAPPDVIVCDSLLPGGGLAAQLLGVPWVELIPHHLPDPAPDLPPVGLGRRRSRSPLRRLDDRWIHRAQLRSVHRGAEHARAAAQQAGLDTVSPPSVRLVATLPGLERPRRRWPGDAHVVGPLATDPAMPPLSPPRGDGPLVVVTDTTVPGVDRSIGEVAIDALQHAPVRVVVTSTMLPARRDAHTVVGVGPHGPLLAEAALAVGPGGGGFVSKSLAAGVPLVVVPLAGDQREAAARLRDSGVGRAVQPAGLTAFRLRWAVLRQLADRRARRAATELAAQAAYLGPDVAARLVEQVVAGEQPTAAGPAHHLPAG